MSLVRSNLDYAAQVWDPHLQRDINTLENVQKFGLKLCSKHWDTGYHELLDLFSLPSLTNRRLHLKLCHLFKIVHCLCYFPLDTLTLNINHTHFPEHSTSSNISVELTLCITHSSLVLGTCCLNILFAHLLLFPLVTP